MKKRLFRKTVIMFICLMLITGSCINAEAENAYPPGTGSNLADSSKIDLKNWMSDLPDALKISEINIPGTHDSGTSSTLCPLYMYASCQDWQIDEQLEHGIRVFDIRVAVPWDYDFDSGWQGLYLYHQDFACMKNIFSQLSLTDVLEYCDTFLKAHPGETIVLVLQEEGAQVLPAYPDLVKALIRSMQDEFDYRKDGHYMYYCKGAPVPTLGDVRGRIVFLDNEDGNATYTSYENHWQARTDEKVNYVRAALSNSAAQDFMNSRGNFCTESYTNEDGKRGEPVVKWVGTNANRFMADFPGEILPDTIKEVAEAVNDALNKYKFFKGKRYGWIAMDYPDEAIIRKIISTNMPPIYQIEVEIVWEEGVTPQSGLEFRIEGFTSVADTPFTRYVPRSGGTQIDAFNLPVYRGDETLEHCLVPTNLDSKYVWNMEANGTDPYGWRYYIMNIRYAESSVYAHFYDIDTEEFLFDLECPWNSDTVSYEHRAGSQMEVLDFRQFVEDRDVVVKRIYMNGSMAGSTHIPTAALSKEFENHVDIYVKCIQPSVCAHFYDYDTKEFLFDLDCPWNDDTVSYVHRAGSQLQVIDFNQFIEDTDLVIKGVFMNETQVGPTYVPTPAMNRKAENNVDVYVTHAEYAVTVIGGNADKETAAAGTEVFVTADAAPEGKEFIGWETDADGVEFTDAEAEETSFEMPMSDVTVTAVFRYIPVRYTIISGDGQTYVLKSGKTISFTCDGDISLFTGLEIDGEPVDTDSYTVSEGSTVAELRDTYLDTLSKGEHTIRFIYENGESNDASFTVTDAPPATGAGRMTGLLAALMWLSFVTLLVASKTAVKKRTVN